jgi:hypothetical protein
LTSATTANVMTEKIQKLSEDFVNGFIDIITKEINDRVDAIKFEDQLDEEQVKEIAREEVKETIRDGEITVSIEA